MSLSCDVCERTDFKNERSLRAHKRWHTRRNETSSPKQVTNEEQTVSLSFCPCCGANLRLILQALAAASDISKK